ncbi:MAG: Gp49 family protein [Dehalococcoidia bacterium]|nr:Gp49 family protein [Dehalococcoidia bacterium]
MRNEQKLKEIGLEDKVIYYRLPLGVPKAEHRTTVCLVEVSRGVFVRGISHCSNQDQFTKRVGRAIALGRAIQAMEKKENSNSIYALRAGVEYRSLPFYLEEFYYKSAYNPLLTSYENEIMQARYRAMENYRKEGSQA